jgi:triosephosphate isomerase (TIM)
MRKTVIAGNWKMNQTFSEAIKFTEICNEYLKDNNSLDVIPIICPPALFLAEMQKQSQGFLKIGAQNVSEHNDGAFTGEISAKMLSSIPIEFCIIGHSERRQLFHETDEMINKKLHKLIESGIKPIICVGETLEEREAEITKQIISQQLEGVFANISLTNDMMIAYEPVWAIGTGRTATPEQAQEIHAFIRAWLLSKTEERVAQQIPILYGGSVKPENIKSLLQQLDIDGGLIGGASLDVNSYLEMIEIAVTL